MIEPLGVNASDTIARLLDGFIFQAISYGIFSVIIGPSLLHISYESLAHARSCVLRKKLSLLTSELWRDPSGYNSFQVKSGERADSGNVVDKSESVSCSTCCSTLEYNIRLSIL